MSEHDIEFTREDIDTYLKELAKRFRKLNGTKMPGEIVIVGGAAVLLKYDFRKQSRDIDGIIRALSAIKESINYVAANILEESFRILEENMLRPAVEGYKKPSLLTTIV